MRGPVQHLVGPAYQLYGWGCIFPMEMNKHMAKVHPVEWEEEQEATRRITPFTARTRGAPTGKRLRWRRRRTDMKIRCTRRKTGYFI